MGIMDHISILAKPSFNSEAVGNALTIKHNLILLAKTSSLK